MPWAVPNRDILPNAVASQRGADAADMGGQSAAALGQAGEVLQHLGKVYANDQRELEQFTSLRKEQMFLQDEETNMELAKQDMKPGAQDFSKTFMEGHNKRAQDFLGTIPKSFQQQAMLRMQETQRSYARHSLVTELGERNRFYKDQTIEGLKTLQAGVAARPVATDTYIQNGEQLIDSTGLAPTEKDALKRTWRGNAQEERWKADAKRNPDKAAADIGMGRLRDPAQAGVLGQIFSAAREAGVDPMVASAIAYSESGLRNVQNRSGPGGRSTSSAKGIFQFTDDTATAYGGQSSDTGVQARQGVALAKDNANALKRDLGRAPSGWEVYLAHYQGAGGATALLSAEPGADLRTTLNNVRSGAGDAAIRANPDMARSANVGDFLKKVQGSYSRSVRALGGDPSQEMVQAGQADEGWHTSAEYDSIPVNRRPQLAQMADRMSDSQDETLWKQDTQEHAAIEDGARKEITDHFWEVNGSGDEMNDFLAQKDMWLPEGAARRFQDAADKAHQVTASDPGARADLLQKLMSDPSAVQQDVFGEMAAGNLTFDDAKNINEMAGKVAGGDFHPPSWYAPTIAQFDYTNVRIGTDGNMEERADAKTQMTQWTFEHPNAPVTEAQKMADILLGKLDAVEKGKLSQMPHPMFLAVPFADAGPEDLKAAIDGTMKAYEKGALSDKELTQQARILRRMMDGTRNKQRVR